MPFGASQTAGGAALAASKGSHPSIQLDSFLRSTDAGYQHAELPTAGDRFIRKMATYGQVRPSVSFTAEPRVARQVKGMMGMTNLPPEWNDPKGDPREGTFEIPLPPKEVDTSFIKLYENHSLMLPSERYKEHLQMKAAEAKWHADRKAVFDYKKRVAVMERKHPEGLTGIDGPMFPGTKLYADRREHLMTGAESRKAHAEKRLEQLAERSNANEAVSGKDWGSDPHFPRSQDLCIQRKRIEPADHPTRFMNTHERLFPTYTPVWDPERAYALRSHDVRDNKVNIISGVDNHLNIRVAPVWDQAVPDFVSLGPPVPR